MNLMNCTGNDIGGAFAGVSDGDEFFMDS